jgi:hypothetical protein
MTLYSLPSEVLGSIPKNFWNATTDARVTRVIEFEHIPIP